MSHLESPGPRKGVGELGQVGECPGLPNNPDSRRPLEKWGAAGILMKEKSDERNLT